MHVYVHVPFCARRCSYCDFSIAIRRHDPSSAFLRTIAAEWTSHLAAQWWGAVGPIETVYFGGGTPSRLTPETIGAVLRLIRATRAVAPNAEITLEANPEDVEPARAEQWAGVGVTRVSLGVQSFSDPVLRWMHRVHNAAQPVHAVKALRDAGLANLSVDLICGVPDALCRDLTTDLDRLMALEPMHVSLYALTVEPDTPLGKWVARGETVPAADGATADELIAADERLVREGFRHYEVSNAARPGFESRHNRAYWARRPYLGLGPSAHSAEGNRRWWNLRAWEAYRATVASGGSAIAGEEHLSPAQVRLEELYLGLRTDAGVPASSLPVAVAEGWVAQGWARRDGSQVKLTPSGWLRLDSLVRQVDVV